MFLLRKQCGVFYCEVNRNDFHKNITCLLIFGKKDDVTVIDKSGTHHSGSPIIIKPLTEHTIVSSSPIWQVYLAPYSNYALSLYKFTNDSDISILPEGALPFHDGMPAEEILDTLDKAISQSCLNIDTRLISVLDDLEIAGGQASLTEIAARYNISPSRLRTIAKEQIGVPLSMLIVFRKTVKAMNVLSLGATLSEAAHAGGFSDQAHFTRTTRKMFGTTPSAAAQAFDYEK